VEREIFVGCEMQTSIAAHINGRHKDKAQCLVKGLMGSCSG